MTCLKQIKLIFPRSTKKGTHLYNPYFSHKIKMAVKRRDQYGPILNRPHEPIVCKKPQLSNAIIFPLSFLEVFLVLVNHLKLFLLISQLNQAQLPILMLTLCKLVVTNSCYPRKHPRCQNLFGIRLGNSPVLSVVTQAGFGAYLSIRPTNSLLQALPIVWLRFVGHVRLLYSF